MQSKIWGGIFLVCGTSIGTGILGIPSDTAASGFFGSLGLLTLCWIFSTMAALYFLEAHSWQDDLSINLLSMAQQFFGHTVKGITWVIYLALLYSLMCTYLLAGSSWIAQCMQLAWGFSVSQIPAMLLFIALIGLFIFFGIRVVDQVNRLMSLGLGVSLVIILALTLPHVTSPILFDKLNHISAMPKALPLLITAFGYSIIIPSLNYYFNRQVNALQISILVGSLITLLTYVLWEWATLGNIPFSGEHGLQAIANGHDNGTEVANALVYFTHNTVLSYALMVFAVFAVITSFLGVSMALYHALVDGLTIRSKHFLRVVALGLTYLPPMLFLLAFPTGFNQILSWAGGLVALLLGVLPIAMVWKGRYIEGRMGYRVFGGKPVLIISFLFFLAVICVELGRI